MFHNYITNVKTQYIYIYIYMEEENGPDTGEKELERILYVLKENGYELEGVNEAENWNGQYEATFGKDIKFTYVDGDYINDSNIIVKIQFDERFDYKNIERDEEGDYIYDETKGYDFIQNIYNKLLTTDERIGVANIVNAKKLPAEMGREILSHVGTIPKGGKGTRKIKKRGAIKKKRTTQRKYK